jgi:hypothetical protein
LQSVQKRREISAIFHGWVDFDSNAANNLS